MTKKKLTKKEVEEVEKITRPVKPPRKIALCGCAPSTRELIPWESDWEIWGQADATADAKNPSRWFDIAPYNRIVAEFPDYHKWLEKQKFPWPRRDQDGVLQMTGRELNWLLDGIDLFRVQPHKDLSYERVA